MTAPQQVASTAKDETVAVAQTAAAKASDVVGSATSATAEVAGTAKEQAANVLGEGLDQARTLAESVRTQVAEQLSAQSDRLTESLRTLSTQLAEGDTSGLVGQLLSEASAKVSQLASYTERTGPAGLLHEARSYARRNPGSFLLGAAAAGLVTGRLVKGLSGGKNATPPSPDAASGAYARPGTLGTAGGTASGDPTAGITVPAGTGRAAGYAPSPDPRISYATEPTVEVYPTLAETPLAPTYGTVGGLR